MDNKHKQNIFEACRTGSLERLQEILKTDSNTNINLDIKYNGRLLNAGANLTIKDIHGKTALIYASQNGHISCIEALLKSWCKS